MQFSTEPNAQRRGEAIAVWLATRESEVVHTSDLSLGGVTVLAQAPHTVGEGLLLRFPDIDEPFACEVSHRRGRPSAFALRFLKLSAVQASWVSSAFGARLTRAARENGPRRRRALVGGRSAIEFANAHGHGLLIACAHDKTDRSLHLRDEIYVLAPLASDALWSNVVIGRDEHCDVHIVRNAISRHHASCERDPNTGVYLIWDHGSRNGTRIDGSKIAPWQPRRLRSENILELGDAKFLFVSPMDAYGKLTEDGRWDAAVGRSPLHSGGRS